LYGARHLRSAANVALACDARKRNQMHDFIRYQQQI